MKIWHVMSGEFSPQKVCGVNNTVLLIVKEQALLGHSVAVLLDTPPDSAAKALAEQTGLELVYIPVSGWRYNPQGLEPFLSGKPPQIVHMHSVFIPQQATLGSQLVQNKIPYVITPHGGLEFRRSRAKKLIYSWLVEKSRFKAAAAIAVVSPKEEETVRAFVPAYRGALRWVANPVDTSNLDGHSWKGNIEAKRLIFLGRFDVLHKGLDILVEIARWVPEIEFHLYGNSEPKTKQSFEELQRNLPANVYFHSPVFGAEKMQVLTGASLYIQTSRWEGFPISIAEAMYLGVPCAVADSLNMSELLRLHDLGLMLPPNPQEAASRLGEVLAQPTRLWDWSERARSFAQAHFKPREAARAYLNLYEEILNP